MLSKLSIAIPTYNRNDYLLRLLKTIPKSFEGKVIISDNGSYVSDDIKEEYKDYNFIELNDKVEMFQNWNIAVDHIETEWFILPSDDDLFCPGSFEIINEALNQNPEGDIFIFGHNVINEHDQILTSWKPEKMESINSSSGFNVFAKGVDARCPSIIFRTELARKMGRFDETFEYTAADSLLIQKCLIYGNGIFVPEIISSYRTWPNNFTSQLISTKGWMDKIQRWTDKIEEVLKVDSSKQSLIQNMPNFKDEIFARNLIAGLSNIKKKVGIIAAIKFITENRFPFHADFKTKLGILKAIIR